MPHNHGAEYSLNFGIIRSLTKTVGKLKLRWFGWCSVGLNPMMLYVWVCERINISIQRNAIDFIAKQFSHINPCNRIVIFPYKVKNVVEMEWLWLFSSTTPIWIIQKYLISIFNLTGIHFISLPLPFSSSSFSYVSSAVYL